MHHRCYTFTITLHDRVKIDRLFSFIPFIVVILFNQNTADILKYFFPVLFLRLCTERYLPLTASNVLTEISLTLVPARGRMGRDCTRERRQMYIALKTFESMMNFSSFVLLSRNRRRNVSLKHDRSQRSFICKN